jgi:hypothetical protein
MEGSRRVRGRDWGGQEALGLVNEAGDELPTPVWASRCEVLHQKVKEDKGKEDSVLDAMLPSVATRLVLRDDIVEQMLPPVPVALVMRTQANSWMRPCV